MLPSISAWVREFLHRDDGPTAVEYAIMMALIVVVCVTSISTVGKNANKTFTKVGNSVKSTRTTSS